MYVLDGIINGIIHRDIMLTFYYLSVHIGTYSKVRNRHRAENEFAKKNKRAIWKYSWSTERIPKLNKRRAFNKALGPEKNIKYNKSGPYVYSGL